MEQQEGLLGGKEERRYSPHGMNLSTDLKHEASLPAVRAVHACIAFCASFHFFVTCCCSTHKRSNLKNLFHRILTGERIRWKRWGKEGAAAENVDRIKMLDSTPVSAVEPAVTIQDLIARESPNRR